MECKTVHDDISHHLLLSHISTIYDHNLILIYHLKHVLVLAGASGLMSLTFSIVPARAYSLTLGLTRQKLTSNLL